MNGQYYIYKHYTKDDNKLFYIGLGRNKRAYQTTGRNKLWTNMYKKHGRIVEINSIRLTLAEANLLERKLIKKYGKIIDGTGVLSNISDGGESIWNRNKCKEEQPRYGQKNSQKQKDIASENMKKNNPMYNKELIEKMVISKTGVKWNKNHKGLREVEVYKDGELIGFYSGPKEASEKLSLKYSSLYSCLNGKRNSLYGYKIKYKK